MSNLLEKASIILTPTAYNNGEALCVKPSDGSGDFDFSRNSAATRVNAQGLVENVQILSSNLVQNGDFSEEGAEEVSNGSFSQEGVQLVTNGSFDTDSDWSVISGFPTISSGKLNIVSSSDKVRQSLSPFDVSKVYKVEFTISNYISGGALIKISNPAVSATFSSNGTHTFFLSGMANNALDIIGVSVGGTQPSLSIDNVSVREVGQDWDLGTGWSIGDGYAESDGTAGNNALQQTIFNGSELGNYFKLQYEITSYTSGTLLLRATGFHGAVAIDNSVGVHTLYLEATSTSTNLVFVTEAAGFNGSITNISVKEVGQNWTFSGGAYLTSLGARITSVPTAGILRTDGYLPLVVGNNYKITYEIIENISGNLKFDSAVNNVMVSSVGVHTKYFEADLNYVSIARTGSSVDVTITNISVIEITDDTNLPRINYEGFSYQDALGSELVVNGSFDVNGNWPNFGTPLVSEQSSTRYYTAPFSWYVNGDAFRQGIFSPNNFTLTNGKTYNVSLWVYALDGAEILSGISNTDKSVFTSHAINQNEWTNITYSAIANATSASYISILTSSSTLEFYVDNVSVKEYLGQSVVPGSGCGSWLFESQSTNLIEYSSDYSQSYWTKQTGITATYNTTETLSPDGTYNATKFVGDGTTGVFKASISVSGVVSRSVYLKSVTGTTTATFKEPNTNVPSPITLTITNEWQRFEMIGDNGSSFQGLQIDDITSDGVYMWGAQLEQQSYATSYIPTSGSSVTRNQDVCTNGGSLASINSTSGTLYAEIAALANDGTNRAIAISDGSTSNVVRFYYSTTDNRIVGNVKSGGITYFNFNNVLVSATDFLKVAVSYKINEFKMYVNGTLVFTDTSGNTPIGLNELAFDNGAGNDKFYGKTKALAVFPYLSDEELTELTTI